MGREEKGEGGDRGELGRKGRVKRGQSNQASNHTPKQKWALNVLKGTKWIANTKKQRLKI